MQCGITEVTNLRLVLLQAKFILEHMMPNSDFGLLQPKMMKNHCMKTASSQ